MPFAEHCVIQANKWARSVFLTSMGGTATFKEQVSSTTEALIKVGFKCWEGV